MTKIRIASRKSELALVQTRFVAERLQEIDPNVVVEIVEIKTRGDQVLNQSLSRIGGKGLFIKELEQAMLDGRADMAVHSMKDMETTLPAGFGIACVLQRHRIADAFVSNTYVHIDDLPDDAIVGTSSPRRHAQLRAYKPNLRVVLLRGNVQTRLAKLDEQQYDAIILASAGLHRLNLSSRIRHELSTEHFLPAIAQGALAVESKEGSPLLPLLSQLDDRRTRLCVAAERTLGKTLGGSCFSPIAALGELSGHTLQLRGWLSTPEGERQLHLALEGTVNTETDAEALGKSLGEKLLGMGGASLL